MYGARHDRLTDPYKDGRTTLNISVRYQETKILLPAFKQAISYFVRDDDAEVFLGGGVLDEGGGSQVGVLVLQFVVECQTSFLLVQYRRDRIYLNKSERESIR